MDLREQKYLTKNKPDNQVDMQMKCFLNYNLTNVNDVLVIKVADLGQTIVH